MTRPLCPYPQQATYEGEGDTHDAALRALGNRLVGILHGCLAYHAPYSETTAWAHRTDTKITQAA